jgi:glycosyltransferase involved in cell wall biosynthesis
VIEAAALVRTNPKIQLVIVGTGPKEEELKRLAQSRGVQNVVFLGRRHYWEMPKINDLADVLLIHLKDLDFMHATIPGKTQVSLASGRPILMAVRGDAADLVREAGAGVICEPENPMAIAKAMLDMSMMPKEELEAMGARGRKFYLEQMALDIGGSRVEQVFLAAQSRSISGRARSASLQ